MPRTEHTVTGERINGCPNPRSHQRAAEFAECKATTRGIPKEKRPGVSLPAYDMGQYFPPVTSTDAADS